MRRRKRKINAVDLFKYVFGALFGVIFAVFKTVFVDLFKNMHLYIIMATNKGEREKIRKEAELNKKVSLIYERLEVVERLLYSMFNDPSYTKRDAGKTDLKDLEREAKK
jgi:hypothetical protein